MISKIALILFGLSSCADYTQSDYHRKASFELCNTNVDVYSVSDDGITRIVCSDGSKFALKNQKTLDTMRDINIEYCNGGGLGAFSESNLYYTFKCKNGQILSLPKK